MMKILMLLNFARGSRSLGSPGTPQACSDPPADVVQCTSGKASQQTSSVHTCIIVGAYTAHWATPHITHHTEDFLPMASSFSVAGRKKQTIQGSAGVPLHCALLHTPAMLRYVRWVCSVLTRAARQVLLQQ